MKQKELIRKDLGNFLYDNMYTYKDIHWRTTTVIITFNLIMPNKVFVGFTEKELKKFQKWYEKNINMIELYGLEKLL